MAPTATFVAECQAIIEPHRMQPVTPQSVATIHDALVICAMAHGYDHRPQIVTIVSSVGILMADPAGHDSFVVK